MPRTRRQGERSPRPHLVAYLVVAVVFLGLGVGAAVAVAAIRSPRTPADRPATATAQSAGTPVAATPVDNRPIVAPDGPPDSPETAVAQFLAAEQRGDFAASYGLLSDENRSSVGTVQQWVAAHGELPQVTAWRLDGVEVTNGVAQVSGTLGLQPELDEIIGLVPGSVSATWEVLSAGEEWAVDFDASSLEPRYPSDDGVAAAAAEWVEQAQACGERDEYAGGLIGARPLVDDLCRAPGDPDVGDPRPLETDELDLLLPPFGAEADGWARAVDVAAPVPLRLLLAPIGDRWVVVAVARAQT